MSGVPPVEFGLRRTVRSEWQLYVDVDDAVLEAVTAKSPDFDGNKPPIVIEPSTSGRSEIALLDKRIGREGRRQKQAHQSAVVDYLGTIATYLQESGPDKPHAQGKLRELTMHSGRSPDGRVWMSAEIARPNADDTQISAFSTEVMQSVARKFRYVREDNISNKAYQSFLDGMVGVSYDREYGMTITTNPLGSCSVETTGGYYRAESETISLSSHNLYSHEQQLICLAGIVAVANADQLIS